MSRRKPKEIPVDTSSELHKLALDIQASQHTHMRDKDHDAVTVCNSALAGLGYNKWAIGSSTPPATPQRRSRLFNVTAAYPWASRLISMIISLGYNPVRRDCGYPWDWLKPFLDIDGDGNIKWGLKETRNRDLACWKYDHLSLHALDGDKTVAKVTTDGLIFENTNTLEALGLNDDDYRFHLYISDSTLKGGWNRYSFDMALVDGVWTRLEYQGSDWDGEYGDSGIVHKIKEEAEGKDALPEPVKAEPVKAEPVKAEPVKAEPVKAEPVKAEPVKAEPVKAEPVKAEPVKTEPAYIYPISKFENYDGDSFDLTLDMGFNLNTYKKCRIRGIDTPELRGGTDASKQAGYLARDKARLFVADGPAFFHSEDYTGKFGRPIGDIVTESGGSLREYLLREKLAVPYSGQAKSEVKVLHDKNIEYLKKHGLIRG